MVVQQYLGIHLPRGFLAGLSKCLYEADTIRVVPDDRRATLALQQSPRSDSPEPASCGIIPTGHDVVDRSGILDSGLAGHLANNPNPTKLSIYVD